LGTGSYESDNGSGASSGTLHQEELRSEIISFPSRSDLFSFTSYYSPLLSINLNFSSTPLLIGSSTQRLIFSFTPLLNGSNTQLLIDS
jgi:hypothetical protein